MGRMLNIEASSNRNLEGQDNQGVGGNHQSKGYQTSIDGSPPQRPLGETLTQRTGQMSWLGCSRARPHLCENVDSAKINRGVCPTEEDPGMLMLSVVVNVQMCGRDGEKKGSNRG